MKHISRKTQIDLNTGDASYFKHAMDKMHKEHIKLAEAEATFEFAQAEVQRIVDAHLSTVPEEIRNCLKISWRLPSKQHIKREVRKSLTDNRRDFYANRER